MKIGDLVILVPALGGSSSRIGIIVEICKGSFARIGYPYRNERARIMWTCTWDNPSGIKFSYETYDALVGVTDEGR